ncbi:MAG: response regulator, partial [Spirochaetia bacterium]
MSKKILLVEDEVSLAMSETHTLEKGGYEVVTVYNGEKAVETVDSDPEINLVLMDIVLGEGIDGAEAAQKILERHNLPIVFLSSHTEQEVVDRTKGITSYGYVVKDSGETVMLTSIKTALELFEAKSEVHDLYENAPCGYHSLDREGVFVRINNTELSWLGYSRGEVVGKKKFTDLITAESLETYKENFPAFKERGYVEDLEFEMVCRDGTTFPVLVNATAVKDSEGDYLMSRSVMIDISERKKARE